jgi:gliding motility-associated-like protein
VITVCKTKTTQLSHSTSGGVWASANNSIASVNSNGNVTGVSAGNVIITYTLTSSSGCSNSQSIQITVNELPVVAQITGTNNICVGSTATLSNTTLNGTWASSNSAVASVTNAGVVSGLSSGTAYIKYTVANVNGCTSADSSLVTVNNLPTVAVITGNSNVCAGSTTTLSNTTLGGVWSSSNTAIATVDAAGIVTGVSAGSATINYTVTNSNNCVTTSSSLVTVNALPTVAVITGNTSVCKGSTTTLSNATAGGVWTSSNSAIATINASGVVTGVSAGSVTITYTVTNSNNCVITTTLPITVNALPTVTATTGNNNVCIGSTTLLANATLGGTWSSSNTAIANVDATGVVTGISAGSVTISYTVTNSNNCVTIASASMTVNSLPIVAAITGNASICAGSTATLSNVTVGGVWSSSNTAIATVDALGVVAGLTPGTVTISYTVTNSNNCAVTSTYTVVIKPCAPPQPVITANGNTTVCNGAIVSLQSSSVAAGGGSSITSYKWFNNGVEIVGATAQTYNATVSGLYTVLTTASNGYSSIPSSGLLVTVNPLPVVAVITGNTSVCAGSTTVLSNTTTGGIWSTSNSNVATVNASGIVTAVAAGTVNISYTVTNSNSCSFEQTKLVTVNALPIVSPITGITNVCAGSTTTLSSTTAGGVWSSSNSSVASVNASGIVSGITAGTATISYTVTNSNNCTVVVTKSVTVGSVPVVSSITGSANVCVGVTTQMSNVTTGGVWSSSNPTIASINASGLVTGLISGGTIISYTVTNTFGCSNFVTKSLIVSGKVEAPLVDTSSSLSFCQGGSVKLTAKSTSTVATYQWYLGNTPINGANSQSYTANVTGNYTVDVTNLSGCISPQSLPIIVTVNALPSSPTVTANGPTTFCKEENVLLSTAKIAGNTYQWYFNGNALIGENKDTLRVKLEGAYTVNVTNSLGCSSSVSSAVIISVPCNIGIFMPKIFTPNADGINETVKPSLPGIKTLIYYRIYSKKGKLLFETKSKLVGWDGKFNGTPVPMDNYIWIIWGIDNFGNSLINKGVISVVR